MLEIKNLKKQYVKDKVIIPDLNLDFDGVGLNFIVGKSGCGKTTLLNLIGTMDRDYSGVIEFEGVNLATLSQDEIFNFRNYQSAYVFQKNSLFLHLTVEQNLKLVLDLQNKKTDISAILEKVGLKGFEKRKVKYLSGGERQRVGIARALAKDAKIILADEPTSALDSKNAHLIFSLLKEISKDKLVIAVTHDVKKAVQYADRVIKLVDGEIAEDTKINKPEGKANKVEQKPAKRTLLKPIYFHTLRKTSLINLFIIVLMTIVLGLGNLAIEQSKIVDEYDYYYAENEMMFNKRRTLETHHANQINHYNVLPITDEEDPYTYFKVADDKEGQLSDFDIDKVSSYFADYNVHKYDRGDMMINGGRDHVEGGNIIIEGISLVYRRLYEDSGGNPYFWREPQRSNYGHFLYDENNDYDLLHGRLPENEFEILITDTVADEYLQNNGLNNSDLRVMLEHKLTIYDVFYQVDSYYHYVEKDFIVSGIIRTDQFNYYEYNQVSKKYELLTFFEQQYRDDPYMNTAFAQPYGYIVTQQPLDAHKNVHYHYEPQYIGEILYEGRFLPDANLMTFYGNDDYRGVDDYVDNLTFDVHDRIIVKSTDNNHLQGNEIIITTDLLPYIGYSGFNSREDIVDLFNVELDGKEISFTYPGPVGNKRVTYEIVGVAEGIKNKGSGYFPGDFEGEVYYYMSNDAFDEAYDAYYDFSDSSLVVDLSNANAKERINLIEGLFKLGYILNPVNVLPPGAFMEFVETQGEIELVDDEGFSEIVNMSVYHLFSQYYNTDEMNEANSVLEIINSIATFSIVMGVLISLGLIYLKERGQKNTTVKLSQLGVQTKKIVILNIITYAVIALLIGLLTYFATSIAINYINNVFTINAVSSYGIGTINRFRLLLTDISVLVAITATLVTFVIGSLVTIVLTYKYRE